MTAPRLTILMPTLNAATYLDEALESVRAGSLGSGGVELLVLDGGSTDATHAIARKHAPLVRLSAEPDGSLYGALNRGLNEARGELIGWLNADDRFASDGPAALVAAFDDSIDCVYGDYHDWNVALDTRTLIRHTDDALTHYRNGDMLRGWVTPLTMIWRRTVLERLGGWNPRFRISGDQDLWVRAACAAPALRARHVDHVVGVFRTHVGSLSSGGRHIDRMLAEDLWLSHDVVRAGDVPTGLRNAFQRRLRDCIRWSVWGEVRRGRLAAAGEVVRRYGDAGDSVPGLVTAHLVDASRRRLKRLLSGGEPHA